VFGGEAAAAGGAGAAGSGATAAAAEGAIAPLTSSTIAPLAGTMPAGLASGSSAAASGVSLAGGGTGSTLGTVAKLANVARDAGSAVSNAGSAAGQNREDAANIGQSAQRTYESALMARAAEEAAQRKDAQKDVYRSAFFKNERPGPYDARGLAPVSPEYMATLSGLEQQGMARLKQAPQYDTTTMKPLVEKDLADPSAAEKAASWIGPTLSTIGTIASYYK
jgi:hypothetical protein